MLRDAVDQGTLSLETPEALPAGLSGLYGRWFRHRFPRAEDYEPFLPLLSVLVAAEHAVPEPHLEAMFGWDVRRGARMLEGLGSLFERRPEGVAPFHKSLRDWLSDSAAAGARFVVDARAGSDQLFDYLWGVFERWAQHGNGPLDVLCLAELPPRTYGRLPDDIGRRIPRDLAERLLPALIRVAEDLTGVHAWRPAISWWQAVAQLAEILGRAGAETLAYALDEFGSILVTLGDRNFALIAYRDALAIRDQLVRGEEHNAKWQRGVSTSHLRIGDVELVQGQLAAALASFEAALAIAARLASEDEHNVWQQRDVALAENCGGRALPGRSESARNT
jgi:tetratricopeptide (TPR) repeat protein